MISSDCIKLVKYFEGCRLRSYLCPAGIWSIGYGTTHWEDGRPVIEGEIITQDRADALLFDEISKSDNLINKKKLPVNQHQRDALCSFIYNVGQGAFLKSTLYARVAINPNDSSIKDELLKWHHGGGKDLPGLLRRREAEAHLYFNAELKLI